MIEASTFIRPNVSAYEVNKFKIIQIPSNSGPRLRAIKIPCIILIIHKIRSLLKIERKILDILTAEPHGVEDFCQDRLKIG